MSKLDEFDLDIKVNKENTKVETTSKAPRKGYTNTLSYCHSYCGSYC